MLGVFQVLLVRCKRLASCHPVSLHLRFLCHAHLTLPRHKVARFIAAKPGSLVSGGHAPVASVWPAAGIIPPRTPMSFDPHGPRMGGHIVRNAFAGGCGSIHADSSFHGCAGIPRGDPPEPPDGKDPVANLDAKFFRMHSSTIATSEGSEDYVPQVPNPTPPSDWLLPGETDENVFKIKHLKGIQITRLPNDATSCREWRAAFLAAVSRIDLTDRDVLLLLFLILSVARLNMCTLFT